MNKQPQDRAERQNTQGLYPRHVYDGAFVGWLILLGIYFVVGFLIGRWTR
jgi:hypothetical protein